MEASLSLAAPLATVQAVKFAGVLAATGAGAGALVCREPRLRAVAMLAALVLTPVLLIGEIWDTAQLRDLRDDPAQVALLAALGLAAVASLAALFWRRRSLIPLVLVAALPFRVPVAAAGSTANLLVPLYLAIAAAVLPEALRALRRPAEAQSERGPVEVLLAAALVLYGLQSAYSNDLQTALEQVAFFLVPFALMARLLLDARWQGGLLRGLLVVVVVEALAFSVVGFWEYGARELLWNPKVINSNQFESYFRVNSVFWDPNIYGRYLVTVMLVCVAFLLGTRHALRALALAAICAVLWAGLVLTFSQSSFAALLVGLAVLAAVRWSVRWTLAAWALGIAAALVVAVGFGGTVKLNVGSGKSLDRATSGRVDLVRGGLDLASERPILGHGSGSFARTYRREKRTGSREAVSASHTEPVTVIAEQGPLGLAVYLALVVAAIGALGRDLARRLSGGAASAVVVGRVAVLAAFCALVFHSLAYAAFLTDPVVWVLLAGGLALARVGAETQPARQRASGRTGAVPSPA